MNASAAEGGCDHTEEKKKALSHTFELPTLRYCAALPEGRMDLEVKQRHHSVVPLPGRMCRAGRLLYTGFFTVKYGPEDFHPICPALSPQCTHNSNVCTNIHIVHTPGPPCFETASNTEHHFHR